MSQDWIAHAAPWIAALFVAFAIAAACAAATARSLVSMSFSVFVCAAFAAATLLVLGRGGGALDIALLGAGLGPCIVLAVLLLSARATRSGKRTPPWITIAAAAVLCGALFIGLPQLPALPSRAAEAEPGIAFWLAGIVFVAGVACLGLLGFGERGALTRAYDSKEAA